MNDIFILMTLWFKQKNHSLLGIITIIAIAHLMHNI